MPLRGTSRSISNEEIPSVPASITPNGAEGNGRPRPAFPPEHPLARLTTEQIEEIGPAFRMIGDDVRADLGEADAHYIRSLIEFHRRLAALSRIVLMASRYPPAWALGTTGLSVDKILEKQEL